MTTRRTYDQACPVAHTLDLVGERWTLLIVRDLMFGPLRFTDLRAGLPGLAPNLLSDRLRSLVERDIVERRDRSPRGARADYALTARGRQLAPVIHELARFGVADWDDPDEGPPPPRLVRGALLALMAPEVLDAGAWSARIELPDVVVQLTVAEPSERGSSLQRLHLGLDPPSATSADVCVRTTLGTLLALRRGSLGVVDALDAGRLDVAGRGRPRRQLARLLGWGPPEGT